MEGRAETRRRGAEIIDETRHRELNITISRNDAQEVLRVR